MRYGKLKRIIALVIIMSVCWSVPVTSFAAEKEKENGVFRIALLAHAQLTEKTDRHSAREKNGIRFSQEFHVYNHSMEEFTECFLSETRAFYLNEDWECLYKYCSENIRRICHIMDIVQPERMDIAKTRICNNAEYLLDKDGLCCEVDYAVRGTIYYNPNSYYISTASTPVRTSLILMGPPQYMITTSHEYAHSSIAANHLSVSFNYSFRVNGYSAWGDPTVFGTTSVSFSIIPD